MCQMSHSKLKSTRDNTQAFPLHLLHSGVCLPFKRLWELYGAKEGEEIKRMEERDNCIGLFFMLTSRYVQIWKILKTVLVGCWQSISFVRRKLKTKQKNTISENHVSVNLVDIIEFEKVSPLLTHCTHTTQALSGCLKPAWPRKMLCWQEFNNFFFVLNFNTWHFWKKHLPTDIQIERANSFFCRV